MAAATVALMMSCEGKIDIPDVPEPGPDPIEVEDEVWINDCPKGFALGREMHIYASFNKEIPAGYRASLTSSDESVLRVSPGTSGWDFYVTGVSKGPASLTLSYNGASRRYDVNCYQKVIPTVTFTKDYELTFVIVPSDSDEAVEISDHMYLEMDGKAAIEAEYIDDRIYGHDHKSQFENKSVRVHFSLAEVPQKERFIISDMSDLMRWMDVGVTSYYWDEALPRTGQPGYEDYREDYYPDLFEIRYRFFDDQGRSCPLTFDFSQVENDGWKGELISITQD